jgi:chaperonin cofactor prefoldin
MRYDPITRCFYADAPSVTAVSERVKTLELQVETLIKHVDELLQRIQQLESELAGSFF